VTCFDTTKSYIVRNLSAKRPDILLIPFAAMGMPASFPQRPRDNWAKTYYEIPSIFAKLLRIPAASSNKTGDFLSPMPMGFGMQYHARYFDRTAIVDNNGTVLSTIDGEPGFAIAMVETRSEGNATDIEIPSDRWFLSISQFTRSMCETTQKLGMIRYAISWKRRKAASQIVDHN
jgi:hypothetical protein